jgi:hypothetical protein
MTTPPLWYLHLRDAPPGFLCSAEILPALSALDTDLLPIILFISYNEVLSGEGTESAEEKGYPLSFYNKLHRCLHEFKRDQKKYRIHLLTKEIRISIRVTEHIIPY